MSGAEVIGLVSGIVAIIGASIKTYKAAEDASGLPQSFREVASRLPLIQDSLTLASTGMSKDSLPPEPYDALKGVLEACAEKATALHKVFQAVIPPAGASRAERYLKALKTIPKADEIGLLMEGIVADLQILTVNLAVKAATRVQIDQLMSEIKSRGEAEDKPPVTLNNMGPGKQFAHSGVGNQNVASGTATQINGTFSGGTFSFTQN
ncbi:hypothetical protein QQX98_001478 [Neonectria punicea]|uniref:NACHT-NTPase and P-loop NTPases N-terminal domain-containing protein n=1 Tax=Neonectria punicea TaxID=979145 RepID=A0ABR1HP97_9HYPO